MKIQLKRNLNPHPHRLRCVACWESFFGSRSRFLLCRKDGSIAGDVCKGCLDRGVSHIQQQLKDRAISLFQQPLTEDISPSPHKQALELWELATEPLVTPSFFDGWWQRILIFAAKTQDLKIATRRVLHIRSRQPKPFQITFEKEEPSSFFHSGDPNGKDN